MTLTPAKALGWNTEDPLTSDEMNHLQAELLKAIDGLGGGVYVLEDPLEFQGADLNIANDLEVLATGRINVNAGGSINIESGASLTVADDGTLNIAGDVDLLDGGNIEVKVGAVIRVEGAIEVETGGTLDVEDGGTLRVRSAGELLVQNDGNLNLDGGADINLAAGANISVAAGGKIAMALGQDLTVSAEAGVAVELCLTPVTGSFSGGAPVWDFRSDLDTPATWGWVQLDASLAIRRPLVFAVPVREGDIITDFNVFVDGDLGSASPHSALPATLPKVDLIRINASGTATELATATDTSATQPDYDLPHAITPSSPMTPYPVPGTRSCIYLVVYGEAGADSENGYLGVTRANVTVTRNSVLGTGVREYA